MVAHVDSVWRSLQTKMQMLNRLVSGPVSRFPHAPVALRCSVDRMSRDREVFREVGNDEVATFVHPAELQLIAPGAAPRPPGYASG